jgi:hypothetical protein
LTAALRHLRRLAVAMPRAFSVKAKASAGLVATLLKDY